MCVCVTMCVSMPGARAGVCTWQQEHPPSRKTQPGPALLTCNGQDDNHKIENVPADSEVVMAQGQHLEHTLSCEDDDKDHVDVVQDVHLQLALVVCLHHHGDHVEADEDHDHDVEHLLCHKVVHLAQDLVLQHGKECRDAYGWVRVQSASTQDADRQKTQDGERERDVRACGGIGQEREDRPIRPDHSVG